MPNNQAGILYWAFSLRRGRRALSCFAALKVLWGVACLWWVGLLMMSPVWVQPVRAESIAFAPGELAGRKGAQRMHRLTDYLHKTHRIHRSKAHTMVQAAVHHGRRHKLKPELILAVIAVESSTRERAVSRRGARGLMQVIPRWHGNKLRRVGGSRALFDPRKNIAVGTDILAEYLTRNRGNLRKTLLHYSGNRANPRSRYPGKVLKVYRGLRTAARTG